MTSSAERLNPPRLEIDRVCADASIPPDSLFRHCADLVLAEQPDAAVAIRIVDETEGQALNRRWRDRDRPTNVLAFPARLPAGCGINFLGDLVLCAPVVAREAVEQGKQPEHHWSHLTIHGILHLLGFDHTCEEQAREMEARETELLRRLGIADPYTIDE